MNKMKKTLISLLLCLSCLGTVGCFGGGGGDTSSSNNPQTSSTTPGGVVEYPDTDHYVLKDGQTNYKIVIPVDADKNEVRAAEELTFFFKEATGIKLETVTDAGKTEHNAENQYFAIGETALIEDANLGFEKSDLSKDEVRVKTKDKTIYCLGGGQYGTLYSVYSLLESMFNYDFFFTDTYYIDQGVSEKKLKDYSIESKPDFEYRCPNIGYTIDNNENAKRMRYDDRLDDGLMRVGNEATGVSYSLSNHNSFIVLPPSIYNKPEKAETYHPSWYSTEGEPDQLCYTARGNAEEYQLMLQETMKVVKENFIKDRINSVMSISIQDKNTWCKCDACQKDFQDYGAASASVIRFLNDLNDLVKEWFASEDGKEYARDYKLAFLAYFATVGAPAKLKAGTANEYEPTMKADPEIAVIYAPIEGDFSRPIEDPNSTNNNVYHNMIKWSVVCDHMMMWSYSTVYSDYLVPVEVFNAMQQNFQFYKSLNTFWMFHQCQHSQSNSASGWLILRTYLDSKLQWNVNADMNYYIDKFFTHYFEDAAPVMRQYFEDFRLHWEYLRAPDGANFNRYMMAYWSSSVKRTDFWKKTMLLQWRSYCEQALEVIDYLKVENPEKYKALRERIVAERVSPNYLLLLFYQKSSNAADVDVWKSEFKEDVSLIGLSRGSESTTISDVYETLGIN